jgi:glucose-6-phosphate 1-dehydrogenase
MNDCTIIIIGITGDLARRKLIPALYKLIALGKLKKFLLVGAALEDTSIDQILQEARSYIQHFDEDTWNLLRQSSYYIRVDVLRVHDFASLQEFVSRLEHAHAMSGNRLLYCSTAANFFCPITEHAVRTCLIERRTNDPWHRVVYEKPFGHDLQSAHDINTCLSRLLDDEQIYRIDHYLTEELVSNIALVRFTNCVFEPLWNSHYISQVQIILNEKLCVGNRGGYYDKYGALKDMLQNHMLELLALIGMEAPKELTGEQIRAERAVVLKQVRVIDALIGQYAGYLQEPHVQKDSRTETFAAAHLIIDNARWKGVPFFLKTGKCLRQKDTVIHIQFKAVECLLAKQCPSEPNYLTIQVTPDPSFFLTLNVKQPGFVKDVVPVRMEFCHSCYFKEHSAESYEVIFEEVMRGEHSVSVRFDEIEHAWKVVDAIHAMNLPLYQYERGSHGPKELEQFSLKHGMRWRS